jgi:hypothetical protein
MIQLEKYAISGGKYVFKGQKQICNALVLDFKKTNTKIKIVKDINR